MGWATDAISGCQFLLQERRHFPSDLELLRTWQRVEPSRQAPALTGSVVFALFATALAWNWPDVALLIAVAFGGPFLHHGRADLAATSCCPPPRQASARARHKVSSLKTASSCQSSTICCASWHQTIFYFLLLRSCSSCRVIYLSPKLWDWALSISLRALYGVAAPQLIGCCALAWMRPLREDACRQ